MTIILTAFVDEENCIGCNKCARICPTDAIIGARHLLHTVLSQFCTACEECMKVCPTNCINLKTPHTAMSKYAENQLKVAKQSRLASKTVKSTGGNVLPSTINTAPVLRKQLVADAIARVKARKNQM